MDKMEIEEESSDKNQVNIKKETFVNIGRALRDCYEFTKT